MAFLMRQHRGAALPRPLRKVVGQQNAAAEYQGAVQAGEVFGYIGPNGAGKTTSMRILATLDEPTAGDAFVDGFSVVDDPDRVRRRLGALRKELDRFAQSLPDLGDSTPLIRADRNR